MNLRIWGELLFLVVVLVIIIAVISALTYTTTSSGLIVKKRKKLQPAEWVATDHTLGNETVVIVEFRRPLSKNPEDFDVLESREVGRITNGLPNYEQLYYDNMQVAYNRAAMLNALHRF